MTTDPIVTFSEAIRSAGLTPPDHIEPGEIHRFPTNGRGSDDAGWCRLFEDLRGGIFGDWRTGLCETWQAKRDKPYTPEERAAFRRRCEEERKRREAEERDRHQQAAHEAAALLAGAVGDPATHPYATRKRVNLGARIKRGVWPQRGWPDALLVPVYAADGKVWTVEAINTDGDKDYLRGGRKRAGFHPFGKIRGAARVLIGEGVATVAAAVDATGLPAVAAMDAGNLEHTARAVKEIAPEAEIVILADNDAETEGNPGTTAATEAARIVGGRVAVPVLDGRKCDLWDLWHVRGKEAVKAAIDSARAMEAVADQASSPADAVHIVTAADVRPERVAWIWDGYLAAGKLHIMAGAPGTGKTTLALAMAATVSCGGRWPDGTRAEAGDVLIWTGEDDPADTIVPRLLANGAELRRCHIVQATDDGEHGTRPFDPATDMPRLLDAVARRGIHPRLLIVDPVVSAVAGDSHKNAETRRGLQPVVDLAVALRCAALGISHFTKGTAGRDPVERVTGSVAFGALPRVVFAAAKRSDDEGGGRMLVRAKSNIGPDGGGYLYELVQVGVPGYPGLMASQVQWGQAIDGAARDLLATAEATGDPEDRTVTDEAADWLRGVLGGCRKMERADLLKLAKGAGFTERTLDRAKSRAGVITEADGFGRDRRSLWSIPATVPAKTPTPKTLGGNGDLGGNGVAPTFQGHPFPPNSHSRQHGESGGYSADVGSMDPNDTRQEVTL